MAVGFVLLPSFSSPEEVANGEKKEKYLDDFSAVKDDEFGADAAKLSLCRNKRRDCRKIGNAVRDETD